MSENLTEEFVCLLNNNSYDGVTEMRCFFAKITLFLYNYHLDYLCFILLFIIIIISLFGKIKANYQWFILNQAIWDIAITYYYMQIDKIYVYAETGTITTIKTYTSGTQFIPEVVADIIDTNPYTSLLLLSWSRFLALYFSHFYDRITDKKRIFITIICFNVIVCFFHTSAFFHQILQTTRQRLNRYCGKEKLAENCVEWYQNELLYIFLLQLYNVFRFVVLIKPVLFLFLSIFAAIMILTKIGKQAKFQLKHNRRDFYVSLRVAIVILFQTAINCFLVFLEFTESIDNLLYDVFKIKLEKHKACKAAEVYDAIACLDFFQLPEWLDDFERGIGLEGPTIYPAVKQLRILFESIIILAVMAGYREAITIFFKFLFRLFKKPKPKPSSLNVSRLFVSRSLPNVH